MAEGIYGPTPPQPSREQPTKTPISQQDIQEYIRIQEEMKQIEALLTIAQNMVHKQLQREREKKTPLSLNMQTLAVEGNAQQKGKIETFNALQPHLATEIESLVNQIIIIKAGEPSLAKELDPFLKQLQNMAKSFPKLSENDFENLNTLAGRLYSLANHLNPEAQQLFWKEVFNMYQKMYKKNEESLKGYTAKMSQLKGEDKEGVQSAHESLGGMQRHFGAAAAGATAKASGAGSLPDDFQKAILNHYMPNQQKYLMELAEILMFDNLGAQIGNTLLNIMSDFGSANVDFDFNRYLQGGGKDGFNGTVSQAKAWLSKATNDAYRDLQALEKALAKIGEEIKDIENNKNLSPKQKKELITKLANIAGGVTSAIHNTQMLYFFYKTLRIEPGVGDHFRIYGPKGWQSKLSAYENAVVNGATKSQAEKYGLAQGGGLQSVEQEVNTFQQTYADQGQNQQMMLQMRMTEMQQEWTVVSTSLQLLNQMYMNLAQSLYKG